MSWTRNERQEFINEYERHYGDRLSETDEMLPILHFIHTTGKSTESRLTRAESLFSTLEKMVQHSIKKISPRTYNIHKGDAIKWHVGIALKIIMISTIITFALWSIYLLWYLHQDITNAKEILVSAPLMEQGLLKNVRTDNSGYYYLKFKKPSEKGVFKYFTEYELLNDGTVKVYLGE